LGNSLGMAPTLMLARTVVVAGHGDLEGVAVAGE